MKTKQAFLVLAAGAVVAGSALAQPYGGGPGMMGGYDGYGMGRGMMGGYGGYGMGPGMMGGLGSQAYAGLKLSAEQQKKIAAIQQETFKAMWALMGTMHEQGDHMRGMFAPGPFDEAAARKGFQTMQDTQKAMFEMQLAAHQKMDALLTKEQLEQLRR